MGWLISGLWVYIRYGLEGLTYAFILYSEVRMAEMASMGVGNKAFWDIAPSEEAISDRNIDYVLKRRGSGYPTRGGSEEAIWPLLTPGLCFPGYLRPDWPVICPVSYTGVRSRASIAVAPFEYDNPYLGALGSLPGDRASCSVVGSLNLHLYKDPTLLGVHWCLYPPNFPEETALEAEAELGSYPSLSMWALTVRGQRRGLGLGLLC